MSDMKNSPAVAHIESLLDENSFVELGALVTASHLDLQHQPGGQWVQDGPEAHDQNRPLREHGQRRNRGDVVRNRRPLPLNPRREGHHKRLHYRQRRSEGFQRIPVERQDHFGLRNLLDRHRGKNGQDAYDQNRPYGKYRQYHHDGCFFRICFRSLRILQSGQYR